jgi:signal transduction histidine kinase
MDPHADLEVLASKSEMAARVQGLDWSRTPLGPIADWSLGLRAAVRVMLDAPQAMSLWWGADFRWLYNDAFISMLGARHPGALGRPARLAWPQLWEGPGRQAIIALKELRPTWTEERLLTLERDGALQEAYFSCAHSPLVDDDGTPGGVLCVALDQTAQVLERRRERSLRLLDEALAQASSAAEKYEAAAHALLQNPHDVPFALLYRLDHDGRARLAARALSAQGPLVVDLQAADAPLPLRAALDSGRPVEVGGARPAFAVALATSSGARAAGFLVAGVNPRLPFTEDYRRYLERLAARIAQAPASPPAACARLAFYGRGAPSLTESDACRLTRVTVESHLRIARTHVALLASGRASERAIGARLAAAELKIRTQLAEALHERMQPVLVAAKIHVALAREQGGAELERAAALIDEAFATSRALLYELAPAPPGDAGLRASLESLAEWCRLNHAMQVDLRVEPSDDAHWREPSREINVVLWRAVRELLLNAAKHSGASAVSIQVRAEGGELVVTVSDAGRGFHPSVDALGFGLAGIRAQLASLGGALTIDAAPGGGTRCTLRVDAHRGGADGPG